MAPNAPRFTVATEGRNELGLRGFCEKCINDLWVPDHLTPDQAAEFAADYFRRALFAELEMLVVATLDKRQ